MVTVTAYKVHTRKDETKFITLELTGGLEMVQSATTGKFYATVRKCNIPSTFDETTASMLIGTQMDGNIVRVSSDPYEYVNKRTGEVLTLSHSYAYRPTGAIEAIGNTRVENIVVTTN